MAYVKTNWQDHVVQRPRTYTEVTNPDGSKTMTPAPGEVVQQGTPMSAVNLNHMEEGIAAAAAKVPGAVVGNFAGLNAAGDLTDSGKKAADFALSDTGDGVATSAAKLKTARNLTVGKTTRPFDGTANASWTLDDIGVLEAAYGVGTSIPEGSDLNTFVTPGNYYCVSAARAATLLNSPIVESGFKMLVFQTTSNSTADPWLFQIIVSHNVGVASYSSYLFIRGCRGTASGFASWAKLLTPIVGADGWQTPTLLNGATHSGYSIRYMKDALGFVHFKGRIATIAADTTFMTLPAGYRPANNVYLLLAGYTSSALVRCIIYSTGDIRVSSTLADTNFADLSGIMFLAEG